MHITTVSIQFMDTDDIDNMLIRQLSCLGTSDKEVLVKQFQSILGDVGLSPELCAFFLDMTNWNLQDAVGAYYDHGHTNNVGEIGFNLPLLNMQLVRDVTIGEGESVPPKTRFVKSWRVKNNGGVHWPQGTALCFVEGTPLSSEMRVPVASLGPGGEAELTVEMISPSVPGIYQSRWQLNTPQSIPFGEAIWCIIAVDDNGILDITQQLASAPLGRISSPTGHNPFMRSSPDERIADDFMEMEVSDRFSMHLTNFNCSSPIPIAHDDGTDVPPCTPCTPPHDERE
ncbi:Inflammation and lipid regulator with UBA and NBR1 domain [Trichostrongylus colubriformis]|uniref:Inflammation and lipid regulator with UBA and NBR1 domain n=1 Tax=Trichostrongylus colubriformis TaxID=6319 RepID=A0AAN8IJD7_TRICO